MLLPDIGRGAASSVRSEKKMPSALSFGKNFAAMRYWLLPDIGRDAASSVRSRKKMLRAFFRFVHSAELVVRLSSRNQFKPGALHQSKTPSFRLGVLLWWLLPDSNWGHKALQASALPTELKSHTNRYDRPWLF